MPLRFLICALGPLCPVLVSSQAFMASIADRLEAGRVSQEILAKTSFALGPGGDIPQAHIEEVHEWLLPILPATAKGELHLQVGEPSRPGLAAARNAVHRYFLWHHGISLAGFEPDRDDAANATVKVLADFGARPAFIESLLLGGSEGQGLTAGHVTALVLFLERVLETSGLSLLEAAYKVNKLSLNSELSWSQLRLVLEAYVYHWVQGTRPADVPNMDLGRQLLQGALPSFQYVMEFAQDRVESQWLKRQHGLNPFTVRYSSNGPRDPSVMYSFNDVQSIISQVDMQFGKAWSGECTATKEYLFSKDSDNDGRISIDDFHYLHRSGIWHFTENAASLKDLGALDERRSDVIVTNYMDSVANCVVGREHFRICCANQCESIRAAVEQGINAPTASAAAISRVLEDGGLIMSSNGAATLPHVASNFHGHVELQSVQFLHWLHYAFPQACPRPSDSHTHIDSAHVLRSLTQKFTDEAALTSSRSETTTLLDELGETGEIYPMELGIGLKGGVLAAVMLLAILGIVSSAKASEAGCKKDGSSLKTNLQSTWV